MNEAIKLAIEKGGYERLLTYNSIEGHEATLAQPNCQAILLDPLFWQALGKALGWNLTDKFKPNQRETEWESVEIAFMKRMFVYENSPAYHWHRFIDHIAKGKDADSFFKELINNI